MTRWTRTLVGIALLVPFPALAAEKPAAAARLPVARVHMEQNATDKDLEVLFEVIGGDEGLTKLSVVSPDGRSVVDFKAAEPGLGMRQFRLETPEPEEVERLKAAYPVGVYSFTGVTADGRTMSGQCTLGHGLPTPTSFVHPKAGAHGVSGANLTIAWAPVKNLNGYAVELEQEESGVRLEMNLPASVTSFTVPDGFLRPGKPYHLGIGTVAADGNVSYVETTFTTAAAAAR